MKLKLITSTFMLSAASLLGQTMVTIHSEDFESGGGNLNGGNVSMTSFAVAVDPADAGNNVGAGNVGGRSTVPATRLAYLAATRARLGELLVVSASYAMKVIARRCAAIVVF